MPCAGTDGTIITAQDLFFNAPQRRKAFKSTSDEYNRALDVVTKYAIHYGHRGVGISCKKSAAHTLDLSTPATPGQTTLDVIRTVHGATLARDLLHLSLDSSLFGCTAEGWLSNLDWTSKKTTFLCFINHRLVDSPSLKRSLESMYSTLLPKGRHPWMYLALQIAPERVDVNVHPTKQEVHFLDEDEIIDWVTTAAQALLTQHSTSRVYSMTPAMGVITGEHAVQGRSQSLPVLGPRHDRAGPRHLVRVDHTTQSLDAMLGTPMSVSQPSPQGRQKQRVEESECSLTSIQELRQEVADERHVMLTELIQSHTFVGVVDLCRGLSLVQHGTQLYLLHHARVIEAFAYQLALRQFGAFERVRLDPPLPLTELLALGLATDGTDQDAPPNARLAQMATTLLAHAEMLEEYFSLGLDTPTGTVTSLPALLPRHGRQSWAIDRLPSLFVRLALHTDWTDEKACFVGICRALASAHVPASYGVEGEDDDRWSIQHLWFANLHAERGRMLVPKTLGDAFVQVASLPDLYRVFERC